MAWRWETPAGRKWKRIQKACKTDQMKTKSTSVILFLLFVGSVVGHAQFVEIPDTNFVKWLNNNGYASCVTSNQLDTNCAPLLIADSISCNMKQISNLQGIQYFKSLKYLNCNDNFLQQLPPLPSGLRQLLCRNNDLTSLPVLPNSLEKLYCHNNLLTWLPALPDSLHLLNCSINQLTQLPTLPASLTSLLCQLNVINILPTMPDSLHQFYCYSNQLFCLPQLKRVVYLDFKNNNIQCKPNDGSVTNSSPSLSSLPLCADSNPNGCMIYQGIVNEKNYPTLHPNPATTHITITGAAPNTTATITNLHGQVLQQFTINSNQQTISTEALPPGLYFCILQSGQERKVLRFVKQ
jgi:hypothetical protein